MNPMVKEFLVTILRYLLAAIGAWMVSRGILTADQAAAYVNEFSIGIAMFLIALGSALWARYKSRQKFLTAGAADGPRSEAQIKQDVKDGMAPSVLTPAKSIPTAKLYQP